MIPFRFKHGDDDFTIAGAFMGLIFPTPSMFYFEGVESSKLLINQFPSELAKRIRMNLGVFADRDWNAVIHIDERGIVHVFFGKNEDTLELPEVFTQAVAGSC
jgi:hypothetical protein